MKKVILAMVLILPLVFQSCKDDDDDNSLAGTVWVFTESIEGMSIETHFNFIDESRMITYYYQDGEESEDPEECTYVVSGSNVVFTYEDGTKYYGTIKGKKMTVIYEDEINFPFVFEKR